MSVGRSTMGQSLAFAELQTAAWLEETRARAMAALESFMFAGGWMAQL